MRGLVLVCTLLVPAWANDTLVAGSYAQECATQADLVAMGGATRSDAIATCDKAISDEGMIAKDLSATHVNRGVLYLGVLPQVAERDFRQALNIEPGSGEAYADLGAAEIAQGRFDAGIADINKGLALGTKAPEKAYFNRAVAEDSLGNETAAYFDFEKALALRPGWPQPIAELARFTVKLR